jgi:hypothetical protein
VKDSDIAEDHEDLILLRGARLHIDGGFVEVAGRDARFAVG